MVYMDLGVSSMQIDTRERGFAYAYDAPLDMRMDPSQELTAKEVVNTWERRRLARALKDYGEERYADRIAGEIVRRRARQELTTTFELNEAITAAVPAPARFAGGHPAKRTFQAIRIVVNGELQQLEDALPRAWEVLKIGGRLAALSFHSLEDRRVKHFLANKARGCFCPPDLPICVCGNTPEAELVHRRSVVATPGEVAANPRSKSARLRAARKLSEVRLA
jgi:16S rRNA (cytosine1402-N4)-methyltransferase